MAVYDQQRNKIGRNNPCPCGSGRKFKLCHRGIGNSPGGPKVRAVSPEVKAKLEEIWAKDCAFQDAHGQGKPIITTEFKDWRFVAVGNELHYSEKEKTKYFADFLNNYLGETLEADWGNAELAKPLENRHQILKWYESMCHYQMKQTPDADDTYRTRGNGAMLSWNRLAYDLYLIKHNVTLQEKLIQRLKDKQQFQGARFELCATASMIVAGFEINFEDEEDISRKHAEFVAVDRAGRKIAVEAKSRHRDGVLEYRAPPRRVGQEKSPKVAVEGLIRNALQKEPDKAYFIFIELNLPYSEERPDTNPWFKEMDEAVQAVRKEWPSGAFPANALFFCNDATYQETEKIPDGNSFWLYYVPIEDPKHPLPDPQIAIQVAQAILKRTNIPNEFPEQ